MKRKPKIDVILQTIRNRGGVARVSDNLSDEVAEFFLQEILECPECIEEEQRAARLRESRRRTEH
jgi:hypothetical protein